VLIAHPGPSITPIAVIEKSETAGARIGALQTVAKLVKVAGYFKIYDLVATPTRSSAQRKGKTFSDAGVTKAAAGSSIW
jgi:hypothetical protein